MHLSLLDWLYKASWRNYYSVYCSWECTQVSHFPFIMTPEFPHQACSYSVMHCIVRANHPFRFFGLVGCIQRHGPFPGKSFIFSNETMKTNTQPPPQTVSVLHPPYRCTATVFLHPSPYRNEVRALKMSCCFNQTLQFIGPRQAWASRWLISPVVLRRIDVAV